jgi:hypothetical protein
MAMTHAERNGSIQFSGSACGLSSPLLDASRHDSGGCETIEGGSRPITWWTPIGRVLGFGEAAIRIDAATSAADGVGLLPVFALNAAMALYLAALAANASRVGSDGAVALFYVSIALIVAPIAARLIHPAAARTERVGLVLLVSAALFVVRLIRAPVSFVDHDEFLHWVTVNDIIEQGRLFTGNSLLPVSPLYPGLEIVTAAVVKLTGLSVFGSALVLLATARIVFVSALYLMYERISKSPRIASISCLVYMGSSTFLVFDSHFAYESLAVVFLLLTLLSDVLSEQRLRDRWRSTLVLTMPFLAALAVSHHMTAFFGAVLLTALVLLQHLRRGARNIRWRQFVVAACAIALPLIWSVLMGNPTAGYLGPVIDNGLREVTELFSSSAGRQLFVSADGSVAPAWQRLITIGSVVVICAGLATGFIRSLAYAGMPRRLTGLVSIRGLRSWSNSRLILLTGLTIAFPLSMVFRLTSSGWEIGNRVGPFSFLGVAIVLSIGIVGFWQRLSRSRLRAGVLGVVCAVVVIGGVISAEGPRILVPQHYRVSADAASVEPMGIDAAAWAQAWLGPYNVFASDRINRLLLATYGRQQVATTLQDSRDASVAIQSEKLGPSEVGVLRQIGIQYILSDLRLTTALPAVGVYFDGGAADRIHVEPLSPLSLLKFNSEANVNRLFDNGYEIIYDVRRLHAD